MLVNFTMRCLSVLLPMAVLSACGGGSDGGETPSTDTYQVSGESLGLNGSLTIDLGEQSLIVSTDGEFAFAQEFPAGEALIASISQQPTGQSCSITSESTITLSADYTDLRIACSYIGQVTGQVNNYYTGEAISGAQVEIYSQASLVEQAVTGSDGVYLITGLNELDNYSIRFSSEDYANNTLNLSDAITEQGVTVPTAFLIPVQEQLSLDMSQSVSALVDGLAVVDLPASSLVTASGQVATVANASVTLIDPSADPSLMPGDYQSLSSEGDLEPIESFGAVDVSFTDDSGAPLNLATGEAATVRIPLASEISATTAPNSIPLFYFDEEQGVWIEEGTATLTQIDGQYVYQGEVSHFTTWNADRVYETVNMSGCVVDENEAAVANAVIRTQGSDYIGQSTSIADAEGLFTIPVRMDSILFLSALSGAQANTQTIESESIDFTLDDCLSLSEAATTITLTWGENPRDLDSHLFIPLADETEDHIYFLNKTETYEGAFVNLDVDDTTSFGPEVITLTDFPEAGIYRYLVHHYSGSSTIAASGARIELNLQGDIHIFTPPQDMESTLYWAVFDLNVNEQGEIELLETNEYRDNLTVPAVSGMMRSQSVINLDKYYAK